MSEQQTDSQEKPSQEGRPMPGTGGTGTAELDLNEYGGAKDGERQVLNRRLFMQLLAFRCPPEMDSAQTIQQLGTRLKEQGMGSVIYKEVADVCGLAVLTWSEDPADFVTTVRNVLCEDAFKGLQSKPEYSMLGRTYSTGYEPDLEFWIIDRPKGNVTEADRPWAVWYPLKRMGAFNRLPGREQGGILREHAVIGRAYGTQDLAYDVRLACHGLDKNDNDFIIGLIGKDLYPLSHVVQAMRKTRQTGEFMDHMGPFFVGHAAWQWKP
jgi:chlorite dismutase